MLDRMFLSAGSAETLYVEDVFSTWLYTGNGSTQTITNGIDLSGKGGLVWIKCRITGRDNLLTDTVRGSSKSLISNGMFAEITNTDIITSFSSAGFSLGSEGTTNASADAFASWTFRKAPKFFDVVTWTGNGANRTIAHNLGVAPGCIIVKRTDTTADWQVYHRSNANTEYMVLNTTAAKATGTTRWNSTTPTATEFTVGTDATVNASGGTYVAYLFAHDATADGIIQCGSATCSGGVASVNLDWEPQWVLAKQTNATGDWRLLDNMRGWTNNSSGNQQGLQANTSAAEASYGWGDTLSPTGFNLYGGSTDTFIYIAIRRGPMKTPTAGTSVFAPVARTGTSANATVTVSLPGPSDLAFIKNRNVTAATVWADRLRGSPYLDSSATSAETSNTAVFQSSAWDVQDGVKVGTGGANKLTNTSGDSFINYLFRRAPSFFDVVTYTGTGGARTVNHNLGVAPELMLVKRRDAAVNWVCYSASLGPTQTFNLNTSDPAFGPVTTWNSTAPTSTVFSTTQNVSGGTYVAYLFASCPGVSKVGSYTGNGSSQTINCGFSNGARFFLVKRTDSTGDWWVYDSARGIVAAADPALRLNTTDAEVTSADAVDTDSTGIVVNQEATCNINVNGATYIYLSVA